MRLQDLTQSPRLGRGRPAWGSSWWDSRVAHAEMKQQDSEKPEPQGSRGGVDVVGVSWAVCQPPQLAPCILLQAQEAPQRESPSPGGGFP